MNQKIDKSEWRAAPDTLSKSLSGKQAQIEIAALSLGDQIAADWVPIIGLGSADAAGSVKKTKQNCRPVADRESVDDRA